MKKFYVDPELELIKFNIVDIIADASLATSDGDNETEGPDDWWL